MAITAKATTKQPVIRKPEGRPKVKFGTFRGIVYMSDTLFDEDLK